MARFNSGGSSGGGVSGVELGPEQESTTTTPNSNNAPAAGTRVYDTFQLPAGDSLFIITGIEWTNGPTLTANVICGTEISNANEPTNVDRVVVAWGAQLLQSGVDSLQRQSDIASLLIKGGTFLSSFVAKNNAVGVLRRETGLASVNSQTAGTYSIDPLLALSGTWLTSTAQFYVKTFFRELITV